MKVKNLRRNITTVLFLLYCSFLFGQTDTTRLVKYTHDFRFKDGIFLDFDQVKINDPIPKSRLLTPVDFNDKEFFRKVLTKDVIYFYDDYGTHRR